MRIIEHMTDSAASEGLDFHFGIAQRANTFDAHRCSGWPTREGGQDAMKERLLRAYFTEGVDVADHDRAGRAGRRGRPRPSRGRGLPRLRRGRRRGARGARTTASSGASPPCPTFVFEGKWAVPGAQDPDTMLRGAASGSTRDSLERPPSGLLDVAAPSTGRRADGADELVVHGDVGGPVGAHPHERAHRARPATRPRRTDVGAASTSTAGTPWAAATASEVDAVGRAEELLEPVGGQRRGLRQEREDAAAVVVDTTIVRSMPRPAAPSRPLRVVQEGDVADQQRGRARRCRGPRRRPWTPRRRCRWRPGWRPPARRRGARRTTRRRGPASTTTRRAWRRRAGRRATARATAARSARRGRPATAAMAACALASARAQRASPRRAASPRAAARPARGTASVGSAVDHARRPCARDRSTCPRRRPAPGAAPEPASHWASTFDAGGRPEPQHDRRRVVGGEALVARAGRRRRRPSCGSGSRQPERGSASTGQPVARGQARAPRPARPPPAPATMTPRCSSSSAARASSCASASAAAGPPAAGATARRRAGPSGSGPGSPTSGSRNGQVEVDRPGPQPGGLGHGPGAERAPRRGAWRRRARRGRGTSAPRRP